MFPHVSTFFHIFPHVSTRFHTFPHVSTRLHTSPHVSTRREKTSQGDEHFSQEVTRTYNILSCDFVRKLSKANFTVCSRACLFSRVGVRVFENAGVFFGSALSGGVRPSDDKQTENDGQTSQFKDFHVRTIFYLFSLTAGYLGARPLHR